MNYNKKILKDVLLGTEPNLKCEDLCNLLLLHIFTINDLVNKFEEELPKEFLDAWSLEEKKNVKTF